MGSEQPIALVYHGSAEDYVDGTLVWGVNLAAIEESQKLGYAGRIALHSLPEAEALYSEQAARFLNP